MSDFTKRRTWPNDPGRIHDYVFQYKGKDVGRCYLHPTMLGERWHWTVFGSTAHGDAISIQFAEDEFKAAFRLHRGLQGAFGQG